MLVYIIIHNHWFDLFIFLAGVMLRLFNLGDILYFISDRVVLVYFIDTTPDSIGFSCGQVGVENL